MKSRVRMLVTSVGSLVGQNILDILETRRDQVDLIGTTNDANNPRIYRCDRVYLTPATADLAAFEQRLLEIIRTEHPEIIIAARDPDILVQARWRTTQPHLAPLLTAGTLPAAEMMQDKLRSAEFAQQHGLPFAESAVPGPEGDLGAVLELGRRFGYPLIAKPRQGYGSLGVTLVQDADEVLQFRGDPSYVFQRYLDALPDIQTRLNEVIRGRPLFYALPESDVFVFQATLGPAGEVAGVSCLQVQLVMGRSEYHERIHDPLLLDLGMRYVEKMREIGWVGPFNLQCKRTSPHGFAAFEMNGRLSGGSAARSFLGTDEIEALVRLFLGEGRLTPLRPPPASVRRVIKTLVDGLLDDAEVERLERQGYWTRPGSGPSATAPPEHFRDV